MSNLLEVATATEQRLHDTLAGFATQKARLYAVITDSETPTVTMASEHGDVYDLLGDDDTVEVAKVSDCIAVLTCGWASPVGDDDDYEGMPPSEHPKRRRVRLVVVASPKGVASVLRFQDDPDNIITDDGGATGSLNDAVRSVYLRAKQATN